MSLFELLMSVLLGLLAISLGMAVFRLLLGPSIPDRAMSFDIIMTHVVALVAIYVMLERVPIFLDALIVIAVLGFLGTVALARFIEEGRS